MKDVKFLYDMSCKKSSEMQLIRRCIIKCNILLFFNVTYCTISNFKNYIWARNFEIFSLFKIFSCTAAILSHEEFLLCTVFDFSLSHAFFLSMEVPTLGLGAILFVFSLLFFTIPLLRNVWTLQTKKVVSNFRSI